MGIEAIGLGIKVRLNTIAGLRVYAPSELPDTLELPCALILPGVSEYAAAFDLHYDLTYRIVICIAKQDTPSAFNEILDYIEAVGAESVFAAIHADRTLNGSADTCKLTRNLGVGSMAWGGIVYLSTEFELSIWG